MPTSVRVVPHQGRTALSVDGQVLPGMSYFSYMYYRGREGIHARYFQEMVEAGVRIFFCPWYIDVGPYQSDRTRSLTWSEDGTLDFSLVDAWMETLASVSPDLWYMLRIYLATPAWWAEQHPEELVRYAESEAMGELRRGFAYTRQASMASERWREEAGEVLLRLVEHVEQGPYADRVLGYMLDSGGTEEWVYWGGQQGQMADYSAPALRAFRAWLGERYGSDEGLAEAWRAPGATAAGAEIPTPEVRRRCDPYLLRDPLRDQPAIDYDLFLSDMCAGTLLSFCRKVKAATEGRRLTGAFYGYLLWQTGLINPAIANAHLGLRKLLDSPDLDFITGITSYDNREPGGPGSFMVPVEAVQAAGKLHYSEVDLRTHLTSTPYSEAWDAKPNDLQNIWALKNAAQSVAVYRREFAHQLIHGTTWWNFDMEGGWYSCPELLEEFGHHSRIAQQAREWDMSSVAEVAGIVSALSPAYHRYAREQDVISAEWNDLRCDRATANLYRAGVPIDWWMTDDLGREELRQYKVLYFHNAERLTDQEQEWVEELKGEGRTLVFLSLAGAVTEAGVSADTASELTGIRFRLGEDRQPLWIDVTDYDDELTRACMVATTLGTGAVVGPRLEADDPGARVLGVWRGTGGPGAVVKEFGDWRSIFFAAPPNHTALFREIARTAGCHLWTESGRVVFANRSLLAVHLTSGSEITPLLLPEPMTLTDLITGEVVARQATRFTPADTWWDTTLLYRMER